MFPDIPKSLGEKLENDEDVRCVHVCDDTLCIRFCQIGRAHV